MSEYRRIFSKPYQKLMNPGDRLRFDLLNPICILTLCLVGLLFIYSAQISYEGGHWKRQMFWVIIGLGFYNAVSIINYKIFLEYAHIIYILGIMGLILAAFCGFFTIVPLYLFHNGNKVLPLAVAGLIFYLNPTSQMIISISLGEDFSLMDIVVFGLIWIGLIVQFSPMFFNSAVASKKH